MNQLGSNVGYEASARIAPVLRVHGDDRARVGALRGGAAHALRERLLGRPLGVEVDREAHVAAGHGRLDVAHGARRLAERVDRHGIDAVRAAQERVVAPLHPALADHVAAVVVVEARILQLLGPDLARAARRCARRACGTGRSAAAPAPPRVRGRSTGSPAGTTSASRRCRSRASRARRDPCAAGGRRAPTAGAAAGRASWPRAAAADGGAPCRARRPGRGRARRRRGCVRARGPCRRGSRRAARAPRPASRGCSPPARRTCACSAPAAPTGAARAA